MKKRLFLGLISSLLIINLTGLVLMASPLSSPTSTVSSPPTYPEIDRLFLTQDDLVKLVSQLNYAAVAFKTFHLDFESDEALTLSRLQYLPITLTASGSLTDLASFWHNLNQAPLVFETQSLEIKKDLLDTQKASLTLRLKLYVADQL